MRVALYARVSSDNQAEKDLSIPSQLKTMREYAKKNDWQIYDEYVDPGFSARTADRPEFQKMMSLVNQKEKHFDIILVWKFNRFSRNREDSFIYKSIIRKKGIEVISCTEPVDDTPAGQLLEGILETIDEFYSSNLSQDTLRGMRENAERGFWNGGKAPIGYKKVKVQDGANERNKLAPDPLLAPVIIRIFNAYINGDGASSIASKLNREGIKTDLNRSWNKNTIYNIIHNETYTGTLLFNKRCQRKGYQRKKENDEIIRVQNAHEVIIEKSIFDKVQKIRSQRKPEVTHPRTVRSEYLLSGIIYCGNCNSKMTGCAAKSSTFFYYRCVKFHQQGKASCDSKMINRDEIESTVIGEIMKNILSEKNLKEIVQLTNKELQESNNEDKGKIDTYIKLIAEKNRRLENIYDAVENGKLDAENINSRIKQLRTEIGDIERNKRELEYNIHNAEIRQIDFKTVKEHVKQLKPLLKKGNIVERRAFIKSFVKKIIVNYPQIEIEYVIPSMMRKKKEN